MSEAMMGYLEAAFIVLGILVIGWLMWRVYDPARKDELEAHGRRVLERDDADGGSHGDA